MKQTATRAQYEAAFELECKFVYPAIDAFEKEQGFAIGTGILQGTARILACPVKKNPPNWQHGRVLYAVASRYLSGNPDQRPLFVDLGSAKGFSAVILAHALNDAGAITGRVESVDIIDPDERTIRNSVAECDHGPLTLDEYTKDLLPVRIDVNFSGGGSSALFQAIAGLRVHLAFVDGKHTFEAVREEGAALATMQKKGDVIVFDDLQIAAVFAGAALLQPAYSLTVVRASSQRAYGIAVRQ